MNPIKEFFLNLQTSRAVKRNKAKRISTNYSEVKSVGILFLIENDSHHEAMNKFVKGLMKEGKKVEAMTYFTREHDNPYNFSYNFFDEKDISLTGGLKGEKVVAFMEKEFDYLFFVALKQTLAFDFILASSKAKCRVGPFFEGKEEFFELMVNLGSGEGVNKLIDGMKHYTKEIDKKETSSAQAVAS
ncbi:MAG: hypothetical protein KTR26_21225 [Flammeovirgaceae bacterium]|nr:hypothetical protein [Flammeovirgaceae bacterium]